MADAGAPVTAAAAAHAHPALNHPATDGLKAPRAARSSDRTSPGHRPAQDRVIELSGVLDRSAAESLAAAIDDAIESGVPAITVDLRGVERIDRHGTHALLVGHLRAGDCDVVLSIVPGGPAVMRVLDRVDAPFRYR